MRIKAFMERKRLESDVGNVQEFCHRLPISDSDVNNASSTCARTDSILISRKDSKSHLRGNRTILVKLTSNLFTVLKILVSRVVNICGPQTNEANVVATTKPAVAGTTTSHPGVEERLNNMEQHLGFQRNQSLPSDVYARLKQLEDRILYLESVSPEYLDGDLRLIGHKNEDEALGKIDQRIIELRRKLRNN